MKRLLLFVLLGVAIGGTHAEPGRSWPEWGPVLQAPERHVEWALAADGSLLAVVVESLAEEPRLTLVRLSSAGNFEVRLLATLAPDESRAIRRVRLVSHGDQTMIFVHRVLGDDEELQVWNRSITDGQPVDIGLPDYRLPLARSLAPRAWTVIGRPGSVRLYLPEQAEEGAEIASYAIDPVAGFSDRVVHAKTAAGTITETVVTDSMPGAIAWLEVEAGGRSVMVAAEDSQTTGFPVRLDGGRPRLFSAGMSRPFDFLGVGVNPELRPTLAVRSTENRIEVVYPVIERERSQLSNFWTGLRRTTIDAENGDTRTDWVVEASSGVLFSSPVFVRPEAGAGGRDRSGHEPVWRLSFLYERPGSPVASDLFIWPGSSATAAASRGEAVNLSRSTSRITSPVVRGGEHLELIWMQNAAGGLRPVFETTDPHPIRSRLPIYLNANASETAATSAVGVMVAAAAALLFSLVGSAPSLLLVLSLLVLTDWYAPALLLRRGSSVMVLLFLLLLFSYGLPPLSFAPVPDRLGVHLLAGALAVPLLGRWYRRRSRRSRPTPGQMGGALAAALTAVAAASALAEVMARFAPQSLPGVL